MQRYVLASLAMLLIACGADKATGPETVAGNYTLRTVNGNAVPAAFYQDNIEKDEIVSGDISLLSDNSWTGHLRLRGIDMSTNQEFASISAPIGGTYSLNNGSITLTDANNAMTFTGTVGGGTLAVGTDIVLTGSTALVFHR